MTFLDRNDDGINWKVKEAIRLMITGMLITIFVVWFYFILLLDRHTYIKIHPYTSCIPIVVYLWLRNLYPVLRAHHLNLFKWLGKITLETYLSQIHIYMIGDAKKILVYIPSYPLLNFMVATAIYLYISLHLFKMTVFFSSYLLPRDLRVICKNALTAALWLGLCYALSYLITFWSSWGRKKTGFEFMIWNVTKIWCISLLNLADHVYNKNFKKQVPRVLPHYCSGLCTSKSSGCWYYRTFGLKLFAGG